MNTKFQISMGSNSVQSVMKHSFNQVGTNGSSQNNIFIPRKSGGVTPSEGEYITIERRRKYNYNEKK